MRGVIRDEGVIRGGKEREAIRAHQSSSELIRGSLVGMKHELREEGIAAEQRADENGTHEPERLPREVERAHLFVALELIYGQLTALERDRVERFVDLWGGEGVVLSTCMQPRCES
jgi:hypothetical protein